MIVVRSTSAASRTRSETGFNSLSPLKRGTSLTLGWNRKNRNKRNILIKKITSTMNSAVTHLRHYHKLTQKKKLSYKIHYGQSEISQNFRNNSSNDEKIARHLSMTSKCQCYAT